MRIFSSLKPLFRATDNPSSGPRYEENTNADANVDLDGNLYVRVATSGTNFNTVFPFTSGNLVPSLTVDYFASGRPVAINALLTSCSVPNAFVQLHFAPALVVGALPHFSFPAPIAMAQVFALSFPTFLHSYSAPADFPIIAFSLIPGEYQPGPVGYIQGVGLVDL